MKSGGPWYINIYIKPDNIRWTNVLMGTKFIRPPAKQVNSDGPMVISDSDSEYLRTHPLSNNRF